MNENLLVSAGLFAAAGSFAWWQIRQPTRARRRGIRRLEVFANQRVRDEREDSGRDQAW